jgi:phasin family protein
MLQCSKLHQKSPNLPEHHMLNTDQFVAANKANLDVLLSLTAKTFEGVEQLAALNLQVAKTGLAEAAETSVAALSIKDPQAFLAMQAGFMQPAAEKAAAYGRQVYDIVVATKSEAEKVAAAQLEGAQKSFLSVIESAGLNAPEGFGSGIAMFKSAIAAANNAFDGLQKATRQATEAAEANYTAVTGSVAKATSKAKRG